MPASDNSGGPWGGLGLGRGPVRHDPRTLRFATYRTPQLPRPPTAVDWTRPVGDTWPMYRNNELGCCVIASAAHTELCWLMNTGTGGDVPTDDDVLAGYEQVGGYVPGRDDTDGGCVMLDAANWWRRVGLGGHRIGAYVKVDHADTRQVRQSIALFGVCWVGLDLPLTAKLQIREGRAWTVPSGSGKRSHNGTPGSWGGHAVALVGYDLRGPVAVTWGREQHMTWHFLRTYGAEAYTMVGPEWIEPSSGRSPSGFNAEALRDDLTAITGQ